MAFRHDLPRLVLDDMRQLDLIKGRVAEALVESIFRRAEYKMTRFGRESDLRGMLKTGRDENFSPDFLAMKEMTGERGDPGIYQTHMIEVKYRSNFGALLDAGKERRGQEPSSVGKETMAKPLSSFCYRKRRHRPLLLSGA
jgi:hypothetical protein